MNNVSEKLTSHQDYMERQYMQNIDWLVLRDIGLGHMEMVVILPDQSMMDIWGEWQKTTSTILKLVSGWSLKIAMMDLLVLRQGGEKMNLDDGMILRIDISRCFDKLQLIRVTSLIFKASWYDVDFVYETSPATKDWFRWKVFCDFEDLSSCQFGSKYYVSDWNLAQLYGTNWWSLNTGK